MPPQTTPSVGSDADDGDAARDDTLRALVDSFGLTAAQRRVCELAYRDAPHGFVDLARRARAYGLDRGNNGAGLFMHLLAKGDHFERELRADPLGEDDTRRVTGWRWTRGSHGETYVRDKKGRDVPPKGYAAG